MDSSDWSTRHLREGPGPPLHLGLVLGPHSKRGPDPPRKEVKISEWKVSPGVRSTKSEEVVTVARVDSERKDVGRDRWWVETVGWDSPSFLGIGPFSLER